MSSYCNVCRICLTVCREFMDIFEFAPAIMECAPIKILPGDGFPSVICEICLDKLQAAQHFRVLCIQSDIILRQSNSETTIGIPHDNNDLDYDYDTNSVSSHDDNVVPYSSKPDYTHFLSCEVEYDEPEMLQCDTIIIDDDSDDANEIVTDNNENNTKKTPEKVEISSPHTETPTIPESKAVNIENDKKDQHKILFKCKKCGKKFPTKFKFRKHHKRLHNQENCMKKCKICSRPFKDKNKSISGPSQNSSSAEKQRTNNNQNYCHYCCKILSTKSLLWSDSKRHRTKYSCDKCDLTFKSKCHLLKHKQFHTTTVFRVLRSYSKSNSTRKK